MFLLCTQINIAVYQLEWYINESLSLCVCVQMDSTGYELERLHTEVASLCSRIELLPCSTAKDRLAQSGEEIKLSALVCVFLYLSNPVLSPVSRDGQACG